jgi:hypothetical protein
MGRIFFAEYPGSAPVPPRAAWISSPEYPGSRFFLGALGLFSRAGGRFGSYRFFHRQKYELCMPKCRQVIGTSGFPVLQNSGGVFRYQPNTFRRSCAFSEVHRRRGKAALFVQMGDERLRIIKSNAQRFFSGKITEIQVKSNVYFYRFEAVFSGIKRGSKRPSGRFSSEIYEAKTACCSCKTGLFFEYWLLDISRNPAPLFQRRTLLNQKRLPASRFLLEPAALPFEKRRR